MQVVYHFSTEYKNSAMTELTAVRLAQLGGRGLFDQQPRSFEKMVGSCLAVDKDLASLQMLASLSGDVKPLALSPSSFFHCQSNRRRPSPTV